MQDSIDNQKYPIPDLSYLRELTDGDADSMKEIISIFMDEAPKLIKMMKESAEVKDHEKLKFATHKLITQLTYVGINSIVPEVKLINSGSVKIKDLDDRIDRIIRVIENSITYLKGLI
ncbi:MAG TPA: Hpt domain-containing protein [Bacteroidales bacterium]|mgnify:CR=1 FL=1|nr:Hpt domain-containing protein [Bacteroidales bacterium]HRR49883.1 Hpt domain-containing protein [Bacteroidales bacterium]